MHSLSINAADGTYDCEVIAPKCKGTHTGLEGTEAYGPETMSIVIANKQLGQNHTLLTGSETVTRDALGTATVTISTTWSFTRTSDAELIVTPQNYDNWLPEPGRDELTKGSIMNIALKVQGKNGKPSLMKAKYFELKLSNTSKEPGITINAPINPDKPLPDLRFLPQSNGESDDDFQFMKISSTDGLTGKAVIAAYDGGGWTTLTVDAILDDDTRVQGKLLVSNGETDIRIPKRNPTSHIAEAWLKSNGNPAEMDDKETSTGNNYYGDGLTAYEEYRGVISQGKFKRLDPRKKEIGIDVIKDELPFFSEGIKWFEDATTLTAIIFHEDLNEIATDRKLNRNAFSYHDYDQFVLRLYKSIIPGGKITPGGSGIAGKAYGGPGIPAKVFAVVIDYNENVDAIRIWSDYAKKIKMSMPFTLKEYLANTIAHELGHGVNCWHHGHTTYSTGGLIKEGDNPPVRIFSYINTEITKRPYEAVGSKKGNQESGDLSCIMAYNPYCEWSYSWDGTMQYFYQVPILHLGKGMCNSKAGTSINKKSANGNNNYFGDATYGNCLAQIKLRD